MEEWYPILKADTGYLAIKDGLLSATARASTLEFEDVEKLYNKLLTFLGTVNYEDSNVVGLKMAKAKEKPSLAGFLPPTFEEFVERISHSKQETDYYKDAFEAAAHSLILGEIPHGLVAVIPRFRDTVKARVMLELRELTDGDVVMKNLKGDTLFQRLELTEDEIVEEYMDGDDIEVSLAILSVRAELNASYKSKPTKIADAPSTDKRTTREEVKALKGKDPHAYRLLEAIVFTKPESPEETRRILSSRVARVMART